MDQCRSRLKLGSKQKRSGAKGPEFAPESPLQKRGLWESYFLQGIRGKRHSKSASFEGYTLGATCSAGPFCLLPRNFQRTLSALVHMNFGGNSYGPIIGPYLFLGRFVWTNGPGSSSKVPRYTGIGPWMALPRCKNTETPERPSKNPV